ncbi:MAG TPA: hypothetical protein V6C81_00250, partial [Planktothrix sp.]
AWTLVAGTITSGVVMYFGLGKRYTRRSRIIATVWLNLCITPLIVLSLRDLFPWYLGHNSLDYYIVLLASALVSGGLGAWLFRLGMRPHYDVTRRDCLVASLACICAMSTRCIFDALL